MKNSKTVKKRDFLYIDENVKYTVANNGSDITVHCDHPNFVRRFKSDTVTLGLQDFFNTVSKGGMDHEFFDNFKISLQEDFLDNA